MLLQIRNGPDVLLDQILRIASRDEREKQDEIHLIGELHGRARKQGDRDSRRVGAQRARHVVRLRRAIERRADQQSTHAGGLGRSADARRLRTTGADRIYEHE